jgi:LysM repeat protein
MFVIVGGYFLFVPGERPGGMGETELPSGETTGGSIDAPELIRADEVSDAELDDADLTLDPVAPTEEDSQSAPDSPDANEFAAGGNDLIINWPVRDERDAIAPEIPDREVASFDWDSLTRELPPSQESIDEGRSNAETSARPIANEPAAVAETARGDIYIVQKGDSYWSIARAWYGDGAKMELIAQANPGVNPDRLQIGQKLVMPPGSGGARANSRAATGAAESPDRFPRSTQGNPGTHTVRDGETLVKIARLYFNDDSKWQAIYAANRGLIGADPDRLKVGMRLTIPR